MKEHISIGTILHALHRPVCLIDKLASQVLEERTSITLSQFMLLMVLKEKGTICQRESADMLGLTQAAISRQLIGLNKKRFIKRKIDPKKSAGSYFGLNFRRAAVSYKSSKSFD
jgi:DNA-binding MarR family transcriptional regulator